MPESHYGLASKRRDALILLDRLEKLSARAYVDPYNAALLYDGVRDKDHACEWLERAYREHSTSLYALRSETWFDRVRSDQCFEDLVRRMNFPN